MLSSKETTHKQVFNRVEKKEGWFREYIETYRAICKRNSQDLMYDGGKPRAGASDNLEVEAGGMGFVREGYVYSQFMLMYKNC